MDIQQNQNNGVDTVEINVNIYRYKFTEDFLKDLYNFSKIHEHDHRRDFKEAWDIWVNENTNMVDEEVRRLKNLGYGGDILDKMFKSARYYFRKKSTEKKEPKERREYVCVQKELLDGMDKHILQNINNEDYSPAIGFSNFCKEYTSLLKDEIVILLNHGFTDSLEIKEKMKKTYKNRYTIIVSK